MPISGTGSISCTAKAAPTAARATASAARPKPGASSSALRSTATRPKRDRRRRRAGLSRSPGATARRPRAVSPVEREGRAAGRDRSAGTGGFPGGCRARRGPARGADLSRSPPLTLAEIEADFEAEIESGETIAWNPRSETVEAKRERRLWSLVLEERALATPSGEAVVAAMVDGIRAMGLAALPWTSEIESFRQRVAFLRAAEGDAGPWPDLGDAALLESLETWLASVPDRRHAACPSRAARPHGRLGGTA